MVKPLHPLTIAMVQSWSTNQLQAERNLLAGQIESKQSLLTLMDRLLADRRDS